MTQNKNHGRRSGARISARAAAIFLFTSMLGGAGAWAYGTYYHTYRDAQAVYRYVIHQPMSTPFAGRGLLHWLTENGFDVAGMNWRAGEVEVVTSDAGLQFLKEHGLQGEIVKKHGPGPRTEASEIDSRYLNPQKVEDALKALNAQYPALTRLQQIGTSLEGRPIWALLISTTPAQGDAAALEKPSIIFDGLHHAREIMTSEIVLDVAQTLLGAAQARTEGAMEIVQRWNVWVVPMLNVDGNNVVWTKDNWWRKNARSANGSTFGVDLNRNYPYKWAGCSGSSNSRSAEDYHGSAAASEPETQALMNLGKLAQPTASLSYHSFSELVLYPFGCGGELSGENALLQKIGGELASILPSDSGNGNYTPGTPWQILYAVDGDSMDYLFGEFGATAFTFEVNTEFQPKYDLRAPTLAKHRKAWQYFLNRIDTHMLALKVIDAKSGKPSAATIDISTVAHKFGEKPFQANLAGNFFKVLDPGTYSVRVTLPDGRNAVSSVTMQDKANPVVVTVQ